MSQLWVADVIKAIDEAISDKRIGKEDLVEGLEEIEEHAGEWSRELKDE